MSLPGLLNAKLKALQLDEKKLLAMKNKSDARKRHLREMNQKLKMYMAIADSAISDAARWKAEYELIKLKYEALRANKV